MVTTGRQSVGEGRGGVGGGGGGGRQVTPGSYVSAAWCLPKRPVLCFKLGLSTLLVSAVGTKMAADPQRCCMALFASSLRHSVELRRYTLSFFLRPSLSHFLPLPAPLPLSPPACPSPSLPPSLSPSLPLLRRRPAAAGVWIISINIRAPFLLRKLPSI